MKSLIRHGYRMAAFAAIFAGTIAFNTSCTANRDALRASHQNRENIANVEIGDSMRTVLTKMGRDPEIRKSKRTTVGNVEEWSWVTDYDNDVITTLVFTNRVVTEISQNHWDGTWTRDTIKPNEVLETEEEIAQQSENLENLRSLVREGMNRSEIVALAGQPHASTMETSDDGAILSETMKYRMPSGETLIIRLDKSRVIEVTEE